MYIVLKSKKPVSRGWSTSFVEYDTDSGYTEF